MKRKIRLLFMIMILTIGMLVGCGKGEVKDVENTKESSEFEEVDGMMVCIDTESSPFEDSGLKISIKKGEDGFAEFLITDKDGNETVNYYKFDFNENVVEKYNYVSAMGTAFYYYYDLEGKELFKIEDGDHKDSTDSAKEAGRWDSSAEKIKEEVESLENYFKEQYGKTIEEAVLGE